MSTHGPMLDWNIVKEAISKFDCNAEMQDSVPTFEKQIDFDTALYMIYQYLSNLDIKKAYNLLNYIKLNFDDESLIADESDNVRIFELIYNGLSMHENRKIIDGVLNNSTKDSANPVDSSLIGKDQKQSLVENRMNNLTLGQNYRTQDSTNNNDVDNNTRTGPLADSSIFTHPTSTNSNSQTGLKNMDICVKKQQLLVSYLKDSLSFAQKVHKAIPQLLYLLKSDTQSDKAEVVDFLVFAVQFGIIPLSKAISQLLPLLFTKEATFKDQLLSTFRTLILNEISDDDFIKENEQQFEDKSLPPLPDKKFTANRFAELLKGNTIGRKQSFAELVSNFCEKKILDEQFAHDLLNLVQRKYCLTKVGVVDKIDDAGKVVRRDKFVLDKCLPSRAMTLLGMMSKHFPNIILDNIDIFTKSMFDKPECLYIREACITLSNAILSTEDPGMNRLDNSHAIFYTVATVLLVNMCNMESSGKHWTGMSESIVYFILNVADKPIRLLSHLINEMVLVIKNVGFSSLFKQKQNLFKSTNDNEQVKSDVNLAPGVENNIELNEENEQLLLDNVFANENEKADAIIKNKLDIIKHSDSLLVLCRFIAFIGHSAFSIVSLLHGPINKELSTRRNLLANLNKKNQTDKANSVHAGGDDKASLLHVSKNEQNLTIEEDTSQNAVIGATADDMIMDWLENICHFNIIQEHGLLHRSIGFLTKILELNENQLDEWDNLAAKKHSSDLVDNVLVKLETEALADLSNGSISEIPKSEINVENKENLNNNTTGANDGIKISNNNPKFVVSLQRIQVASVVALGKLMLVNSNVCSKLMPVLMQQLTRAESCDSIKSNCIIICGDIAIRFPNILEPYTVNMFELLKCTSVKVRSTTISVLCHLILNDMIKIKGNISELALCLVDPINPKLSRRVQNFFTELSRKENAIYNILPDIVSRLSDDFNIELSRFQQIIKFLLAFLDKDKHCEMFMEKLCHRVPATRNDHQLEMIIFSMNNIPLVSERSIKKLLHNYDSYKDKLVIDYVHETFKSIILKARKQAKDGALISADELESRIVSTLKALEEPALTDPDNVNSQKSTFSPVRLEQPKQPNFLESPLLQSRIKTVPKY